MDTYFNSTLVRLIDDIEYNAAGVRTFQFHFGTIDSGQLIGKIQKLWHFNSTLVRLIGIL